MTKIRFASWAAVSSLPQAKKVSLDDQLAVNRAHAERHGGEVVAELVVPGESRSIVLFEEACRRISAYDQLRQLIEQRAFDVLIYLDRSRLGRKASLSMAIVELCHEAGILTYETENPPESLELGRPESHDEMLIGAIKSVGAQREIQKLVLRRKMGMIARVKKGHFPHGVPWGWRAVFTPAGDRNIVIDEDAATVIRLFCSLIVEHGHSLSAAAAVLNARGYTTPQGLPWTDGNVHSHVRHIWRYAGYSEIRFGQEAVKAPGSFPAIISEETAAAVRHELRSRYRRLKGTNSISLLSRAVRCDEHDVTMLVNRTIRIAKDGRPVTYAYMRCPLCRSAASVTVDRIVEALRTAIAYLRDQANLLGALDELEDSEAKAGRQIDSMQRQVRRVEAALVRADDAYVAGQMDSERYRHQVDKLTATKRQLEQEIAQVDIELKAHRYDATRHERLFEVAQAGAAMLDLPDVATANAWLRRHFVVYVHRRRVSRIEYL